MPTLAESLIASSSRPLALKMRTDLTASRQRYLGRSYWVVKEPVGLKYFRFQEEEYAILQMLDGNTSLEDIKDRFEEDFAPQKISFQNLQQFVGMLHRSGLVIADAKDQGKQLKRRGDEKRRKETIAQMSNVLALRWKGIDPEWILNVIYPYTRWVFVPVTKIIWCIIALTALGLVLVEFDVFRSRLPAFHEFFGTNVNNWLLLGLVLAMTKVLHEFGHGLTCKHYGGECHEMGFMLLVLTPCLYCNVSDSWMLPNKWQRAFIGFAGMYVEIFLASIATFIWWFADPQGTAANVCLRIMFISSVSTLMFNGNPLLRFDGYYILADVLEVPNMRQKASNVLQRFLVRLCLGIKQPEDPFLPQNNRLLFGMYTVASVVYRWVVVLSILWFLNQVFEPYGLKVIGQLIALTGMFGLVIMPLWKFGKFLYVPGRMDQVKMPNVYVTVGVMAAVVLAIAFIPMPHRVKCTVYLQPRDAHLVSANVDGRLDEVIVRPGDKVDANEPLARMSNVGLELELAQLVMNHDLLETELESLQRIQFTNRQEGVRIPVVEKHLETIAEQIEEKKKKMELLTLASQVAGTIIAGPGRAEKPDREDELGTWSGTLFDDVNLGAWVQVADPFCMVGDPNDLEAVLIIDQGDVEFVREGQKVWIRLNSHPAVTFESEIEQVAANELEMAPPGVSRNHGGPLATVTDRQTGAQRPQSTAYPAWAKIDQKGQALQNGMLGQGKIQTESRTLGYRVVRFLATTFNFEM
jgi:putative peptide zinc metalloprotease protein